MHDPLSTATDDDRQIPIAIGHLSDSIKFYHLFLEEVGPSFEEQEVHLATLLTWAAVSSDKLEITYYLCKMNLLQNKIKLKTMKNSVTGIYELQSDQSQTSTYANA